MNPVWLCRNAINSWRHADTVGDALQRLRWIYSAKLPASWQLPEYEVGFQYRQPLGRLRFRLRPNRGSDAFIFGEVFDHEYYWLPLAKVPKTILDLGANAGFTAVYLARHYPNAWIACVEPVPDNVRVLTCNLQLNGIQAQIIAAAADVADGRTIMELSALDYGHKIPRGPRATPAISTIEVDTVSVPTIMRQLGWERVGLLKVDIEGHESVLFSAQCEWLTLVDAMCIECHDGFGEKDLCRVALRFGFSFVHQLPGIWLLAREANKS